MTLVLLFGLIAGAITGGLIEYLLGLMLPERPRIKHIIAILAAIAVFGIVAVWTSQNQGAALREDGELDDTECTFDVGEIIVTTDVIEVRCSVLASIQVIGMKDRPFVYSWSAVYGDMSPGVRSSSFSSTYTAPDVSIDDTIFVDVSAPGCPPIRRSRDVSVVFEDDEERTGDETVVNTVTPKSVLTLIPTLDLSVTATPSPWPQLVEPGNQVTLAGDERKAVILRWHWPAKELGNPLSFRIQMKLNNGDWFTLSGTGADRRSAQFDFRELSGKAYWRVRANTDHGEFVSEAWEINFSE
jgi:hypothetical protein